MAKTLRIGTRASKLALWQTRWVAARLTENFPEIKIETNTIKTTGDRIQDIPLAKIGDKGLFTKELDRALLKGQIDLVVHSLKDIPTETVEGIVIAAIPKREDPRDAFIGKNGLRFKDIPSDACIATGSLRRRAQLQIARPHIESVDLRGNIDTRLRTLENSTGLNGIILALAGVKRLELASHVTEILGPPNWLPAPGQGALAITTRDDDVRGWVSVLNHEPTRQAVTAERAVLAQLGGGCHVPMGAYASTADGILELDAFVADLDGTKMVRHHHHGAPEHAERIGTETGNYLLTHGGAEIIKALDVEE